MALRIHGLSIQPVSNIVMLIALLSEINKAFIKPLPASLK